MTPEQDAFMDLFADLYAKQLQKQIDQNVSHVAMLQQTLKSMATTAEEAGLPRKHIPTHRCTVCGAFWILFEVEGEDSFWSLWSQECKPCCDNAEQYIFENNVQELSDGMRFAFKAWIEDQYKGKNNE